MARKPVVTETFSPIDVSPVDPTEDLHLAFKWNIYHPDQREYRNQSVEVEPIEVYVQLDIPVDYGHTTPEGRTVLSVAGLRYVADLFDTVFLPSKKSVPANDEEVWEEDTIRSEKAKAAAEDDWDSDADFDDKTETDKAPWDEDGDDWS